jgi:hypothetical protein
MYRRNLGQIEFGWVSWLVNLVGSMKKNVIVGFHEQKKINNCDAIFWWFLSKSYVWGLNFQLIVYEHEGWFISLIFITMINFLVVHVFWCVDVHHMWIALHVPCQQFNLHPKKGNMIIANLKNGNSTKFGVSKFSQQKNKMQCFKSSNAMVIYWLSIKVIIHCQEI